MPSRGGERASPRGDVPAAGGACPICDAPSPVTFVVREHVPVHQHLVMTTAAAARAIPRGRLEMACCERCGFAFNRAFDAGLLAYGADYDNTQTHSAEFATYTRELVARIQGRGLAGMRVVEVGCGKGGFLHQLLEADTTATGRGYDPSYDGPATALDGRLVFHRQPYELGSATTPADLVVCRHVIEHLADPGALVREIRRALAPSPDARVFFETPALDWILEHAVVWDFFYEHCSLFTAASLTTLFERGGFRVEQVVTTFGGQYLWLEATLADCRGEPRYLPGSVPAAARQYARAESRWAASSTTRLRELQTEGPIALWGAGAKGVTFANLVDPDAALIDCIVDLNPRKQGRYLPGTGHPIVAPTALGPRRIATALLMNPNYRTECQAVLDAQGLAVRLEDPPRVT